MILLGDAYTILPRIKSESVDCIVTDPPYGINYKSNMQTTSLEGRRAVLNDSPYFNGIVGDTETHTKWLVDAFRILKTNSAIYIYCHWKKWTTIQTAVIRAGFQVKNMIVLNKSNHGMGDLEGSYAPKHELLLFAVKGRHLLNYDSRPKDVWDVKVKYSGQYHYHPNNG